MKVWSWLKASENNSFRWVLALLFTLPCSNRILTGRSNPFVRVKDWLPYIRLRSPTSSACISNVPTHFIRLRGSEHSDERRRELELGLDHDLDLNIGHKEASESTAKSEESTEPTLFLSFPCLRLWYYRSYRWWYLRLCGFCLSSCLCLWSICIRCSLPRDWWWVSIDLFST